MALLVFLLILPAVAMARYFPGTTIGQLQYGTWLESLAVRPDGSLLLTQMWPSATVYTIRDPSNGHDGIDRLLSIPGIQSIYGVTSIPSGIDKVEKYVLVGSNSTGLAQPVAGSFSAWALEVGLGNVATARMISGMNRESALLNGVSMIPGRDDAVLVADSALGTVGRLDLMTGNFDGSAFVFPEMAPIKNAPLPVGVNGIKIRGGYLYFTNSFSVSMYRVASTPAGLPCAGAVPELVFDLSESVSMLDDFVFDASGNIYVTTNFDNSIVFVDEKTGKWETLVGGVNDLTVAGATAVAFGRGPHDKDTLYVTTSGALLKPVGGNKTEGAKVVAVDTREHNDASKSGRVG